MSVEIPYGDLRKYREQKAVVKVERVESWMYPDDDEFQIRVTHNGYQWSSLTVSRKEAYELIGQLSTALHPPKS